MEERLPIINELFELRERLGLSRDAVSRMTKIPASNIYRWEQQGLKPSRMYLVQIQKFIKACKRIEAKEGDEKYANV